MKMELTVHLWLCLCVCECVCVCLCVCVCVCVHYGSGMFGGGTRLVMHDLHTYTLYCACIITSEHNHRAAAEGDVIREQQLKRTQIGEQQLKRMHKV